MSQYTSQDLIVQKYGGSSLATEELIRRVADKICAARADGASLVVTVSAMGDTTDELLRLAGRLAGDQLPHPRETDALISTGELVSASLMAIAIKGNGFDVISLSGRQAGIRTDGIYGSARIASIQPDRVFKELDMGKIVVVAGFQGLTNTDDTTTLGRGASDLTAVALAASLNAKICEIYTDVDGIFTADPRIVPEARVIPRIGYHEMLEMAALGAKMNPRSIEMAAVHKVTLRITSSFNQDASGTIIKEWETLEDDMEIRKAITGVATERDVARITLRGVQDRPGVAASLMTPLADAGISVDVILQNVSNDRLTDLSFTIKTEHMKRAEEIVSAQDSIAYTDLISDSGYGKVSIVGTGMLNSPGYAARMFTALADADVNIEMITTSEIRITCIVKQDQIAKAANALHKAFELEK